MLEQFKSYLAEQGISSFENSLILAVSGGIDSVTMAHLFHISGYNCAIAHCNFQLRGSDSDADEAFVSSLAAYLEMPLFVKKFDVEERVKEKGISVQMAARELRYSWFETLIKENSYEYLATAHNKNDSVETFFLNLSRGTGIRGLTGIPARTGYILRPLQFASRQDILAFSKQHRIDFREDASNLETKYRRNKIRHDIIPVMEQVNPGFIETMWDNMNRLAEIHDIFLYAVEQARKTIFHKDQGHTSIEIKKLKSLSPLRTWLYELFSPYGFTRSQCEGIKKILDAESGRRSISTSHMLFKDRDKLILVESGQRKFDRYYLDSPEKRSSLPFPMDIEVLNRSELQEIPSDPDIACLDFDEIQFPLTIRHWQHGDYFFPLGMNQIKKLSDFFVDNKIPVPEKQQTWIMASGKKIVWIMGHRIDHRFRITEKTSRVLKLCFQSNVIP
ncbi:MAG: tRNA lysidine(34) synthetase TilS [Bacteroidota bacterium]